jgi:hypothetical protein
MKPKTIKITYWTITILFAVFFLLDGVASALQEKTGAAIITALGYPLYFMIINGVAKVIGSIMFLQNKWKTIKEWAYAGFTVNMLGAAGSHYFTGSDAISIVFPFIFLGIMFVSYYFWKKYDALPVVAPFN